MLGVLLLIASASWGAILAVYCAYALLVLRRAKSGDYTDTINRILMEPMDPEKLPSVSVLVPTRNEETVIGAKLRDLASQDYPIDKLEVLIIDDCSDDNTCEIADKTLHELGMQGRVIRHSRRMGVNASYNTGVPLARNGVILRTDADVTLEPEALQKGIKVLSRLKDVGGVSAMTTPSTLNTTSAAKVEKAYTTFFQRMLIAESSLDSTFPGYGGFALLRKTCFEHIPVNLGSTDGNIAFSVIRRGLRYVCVPHIVFYENICHSLHQQRAQKVRRATRITQSALMNRDMLFNRKYGKFGMTIFPLRFGMMTVCPVLALLGSGAALLAVVLVSPLASLSLVCSLVVLLLLGIKTNVQLLNSIAGLFFHQLYLILSVFAFGRNLSTWKTLR